MNDIQRINEMLDSMSANLGALDSILVTDTLSKRDREKLKKIQKLLDKGYFDLDLWYVKRTSVEVSKSSKKTS